MSMELVPLVVLLVLVLLTTLLAPILRRMALEQEEEPLEEAVRPSGARRPIIPAAPRTRIPQYARSVRAPKPAEPQRQGRRMVSLREARRGMVLMAILGPCRASEPGRFPD
jgi:hypothetical protein